MPWEPGQDGATLWRNPPPPAPRPGPRHPTPPGRARREVVWLAQFEDRLDLAVAKLADLEEAMEALAEGLCEAKAFEHAICTGLETYLLRRLRWK